MLFFEVSDSIIKLWLFLTVWLLLGLNDKLTVLVTYGYFGYFWLFWLLMAILATIVTIGDF